MMATTSITPISFGESTGLLEFFDGIALIGQEQVSTKHVLVLVYFTNITCAIQPNTSVVGVRITITLFMVAVMLLAMIYLLKCRAYCLFGFSMEQLSKVHPILSNCWLAGFECSSCLLVASIFVAAPGTPWCCA